MGGFRSFFIESKLFQLAVEEGRNFYSLKIFEWGKYYMQSVFMGKSAALWVMRCLEHTMIEVNPKHFFTFRMVILPILCNGGPTRLDSTYL